MIFEGVENEKVEHIYCILRKNVENEGAYSGVSHVMEHACLMPYYKEKPLKYFWGRGYTCLDHIILYFISSTESGLETIFEQIITGRIICEKNVIEAKEQVYNECLRMKEITDVRENLVRFISDNRITNFAMGKQETIVKIQQKHVQECLNSIIENHDLYAIRFRHKNEIQMKCRSILSEYCNEKTKKNIYTEQSKKEDEILLVECKDKQEKIEIYFRIPISENKEEYIAKLWFEYSLYLVCKEELNMSVSISDKFYTYTERYIVLRIYGLEHKKIKSILCVIRQHMMYKIKNFETSDCKKYLHRCLYSEKHIQDYINEFQNYILYGIPIISNQDICLMEYISKEREILENILFNTLKIVVFKNNCR